MIWEAVDIPASIITIGASPELEFPATSPCRPQPDLSFQYSLPAIFHACYFSRQTALKTHPLLFGTGRFGLALKSPIPYNASKDLLYFKHISALAVLASNAKNDFNDVRRVAVRPFIFDQATQTVHYLLPAYIYGRELRTVYVVPNESLVSRRETDTQKASRYRSLQSEINIHHTMNMLNVYMESEVSEKVKQVVHGKGPLLIKVVSPTELEAWIWNGLHGA